MEFEFKKTGVSHQGPSFSRLMIEKLRQGREEHPVLDFAAGNLPILGGLQAGMDMTDPNASTTERGLSALSFVPGGKIMGQVGTYMGDVLDFKKLKKQKQIAERLKKSYEIPPSAEELEVSRTGQLPVPEKPPQAIIDSMKEKAMAGDPKARQWVEKFGGEYSPEEIFQKPNVTMSPEQRAANLLRKNEEAKKIAEQWLKDNPE